MGYHVGEASRLDRDRGKMPLPHLDDHIRNAIALRRQDSAAPMFLLSAMNSSRLPRGKDRISSVIRCTQASRLATILCCAFPGAIVNLCFEGA
jgi:hypothetical protein